MTIFFIYVRDRWVAAFSGHGWYNPSNKRNNLREYLLGELPPRYPLPVLTEKQHDLA